MFAFGYLGLTSEDFWNSTPREFNNRVDGVISSYVARVAREDVPWFQNIWDGKVSKQLGEYATKVLKERKNLDQPILNLLGEVKNPYRRIASTLKNQNDLSG